MTANEFRELSERWPSGIALAADLGISRQQVYRYRDGHRAIPEPVARLIRILSRMPQARDAMHA
jgi:predicted transcriptional regulator